MKEKLHPLLLRQLKRHWGSLEKVPTDMEAFLHGISESYSHFERDRDFLDHTMQVSNVELEESNKQLRRKNEMLDAFVYRVSHDLKSPINNIITMLKMLESLTEAEIEQNPMLAQVVAHLKNSAGNMQMRVEDLLDMSRMEKQLEELEETIHLPSFVEQLKQDFAMELEQKGAKVYSDFNLADQLKFGKENLYSLFSNIISNSLKYAAPDRNPIITIKTFWEDAQLVLKFEDNGLGIDLQKHGNKLFGMFNRFHDHVPGSGVGLYIVKKIVESKGGKIEVDSTPGEGTTFYFYFCHAESENAAQFDLAHR